jgi:hypothetical protein
MTHTQMLHLSIHVYTEDADSFGGTIRNHRKLMVIPNGLALNSYQNTENTERIRCRNSISEREREREREEGRGKG